MTVILPDVQNAQAMQELETPTDLVLGRYRLGRRLGSGGFGTVWRAEDVRLGRPVAVKCIPTGDAASAERAEREARAAARLGHPGIVALYEAGADDEACYLVSELVRGRTLGALEAEGALSDRDVVRIGAALCDALAHAHARGVVHRDVKPGNVIVPDVPEPGGGVVKICDFGVARVVGADALTMTGDVVGTLAYMAPEQAEGRAVTEAVDLYALGLVLYEALAGEHPVRGVSPADTLRRIGLPIPALGRVRRDLPRDLCAAVDLALDRDPAGRGTLSELGTVLTAAAGRVGDEPGVVAEGRAGSAEVAVTRLWRREPEPEPEPVGSWEPAARAVRPPPSVEPAPRPGLRLPIPARVAAGAGAGLLVATTLLLVPDAPAPVTPATAGLAAAAGVALLPRLGWLAAATLLVGWLAGGGAAGAAVLVAAGALAVPVALLRTGTAWSLPGAAPALGVLGLGLVFPALAGQARTAARRAALGAVGAFWLVLAEALLDRRLLAGTPSPATWLDRPGTALGDVLPGLLDARLAGLAAVFALAAAVLPWLVLGRRLSADVVGATAWAAGLAAAVQGVAAPTEPRGLVVGAVAAALAALGLRAARLPAGTAGAPGVAGRAV